MGVDELLLVRRLTLAAASPEIRREMQVEDEILSEIEGPGDRTEGSGDRTAERYFAFNNKESYCT